MSSIVSKIFGRLFDYLISHQLKEIQALSCLGLLAIQLLWISFTNYNMKMNFSYSGIQEWSCQLTRWLFCLMRICQPFFESNCVFTLLPMACDQSGFSAPFPYSRCWGHFHFTDTMLLWFKAFPYRITVLCELNPCESFLWNVYLSLKICFWMDFVWF